ncbi:hypothetical protein Hbut_0346 [Hyperthermus butylicus DSM 5456]|uniref:Uncharacterized protein n=1 Tax=Hyperthermus butylicus (strain DSM 5456 / JCM 9403 / PLM1-5) TaxID=415426 RepID=A2BJQ6_HYPBU|nr:hypothetical protein Hbut_0346 [Hyperthermus butylicus DSM 5456]
MLRSYHVSYRSAIRSKRAKLGSVFATATSLETASQILYEALLGSLTVYWRERLSHEASPHNVLDIGWLLHNLHQYVGVVGLVNLFHNTVLWINNHSRDLYDSLSSLKHGANSKYRHIVLYTSGHEGELNPIHVLPRPERYDEGCGSLEEQASRDLRVKYVVLSHDPYTPTNIVYHDCLLAGANT